MMKVAWRMWRRRRPSLFALGGPICGTYGYRLVPICCQRSDDAGSNQKRMCPRWS
jgi:hypothetical protein